ncbi:hypothetical protein OIO90_004760 [Microbotryomycetes sp. JL221]|nr:hypothetical protein OIO90_004760 [Microbotryomycetes sp. JL221]
MPLSSSSRWLTTALPHHPIFTLPPEVDHVPSRGVNELVRPASPNLSAIIPTTTNGNSFNDDDSAILFSSSSRMSVNATPTKSTLFNRATTPKRSTPLTTSTSSRQALTSSTFRHGHHNKPERRDRSKPTRTSTMALVRGTELIVAVGQQLRIASLQQVKTRAQDHARQWQSQEGRDDVSVEALQREMSKGDYKTLYTPAIDFDIQQIVVNPTSKLLAVVGAHSVAVVVLPRKGWTSSVSPTIECRSLLVGRFYHHLPGSPKAVQVMWHPWGEHASCLLVLTCDAIVREYNIADDVDESTQTLTFNEKYSTVQTSSSKASTSFDGSNSHRNGRSKTRGFSAVDESATEAVSFCLGQGQGDWGPATLYCLMKNGDVKAICPFLPKKATIPASWIHALSSFVSTKVDYLTSSVHAASDDPLSLVATTPTKANATRSSILPNRKQKKLADLYQVQLQFVNHLVKQANPSSLTRSPLKPIRRPSSMDLDEDEQEDSNTALMNKRVRIVTPTHLHPQGSLVQGPLFMQPEPVDLDLESVLRGNESNNDDDDEDDDGEDSATDICYVNFNGSTEVDAFDDDETEQDQSDSTSTTQEGFGALLLSFKSGRVDVCLELEKIEARWGQMQSQQALVKRSGRQRSKGGYGIDDDDEDERDDGMETPTLVVYETIDLGLVDLVNNHQTTSSRQALRSNWPTIVKDPLYNDTVYVKHNFGTHCLCFSSWLETLLPLVQGTNAKDESEVDQSMEQKQIDKALNQQEMSEVVWILKTLPLSSESKRREATVDQPAVEGLSIVNDVYLGYSVMLLTSQLQFVGIEIPLRVDSRFTSFNESDKNTSTTTTTTTTKTINTETPGYVSLLDEPFQIPSMLLKRSNLVARVPPPTNPGSSTNELVVTPQTLRYLGQQVESFQLGIRDLVQNVDLVQSRLELQMKELSRQLNKVSSLKNLVENTQEVLNKQEIEKFEKIQHIQQNLMQRIDKLLQNLMNQHNPNLSSFELKWFDELKRIKKEFEKFEIRLERSQAQVEDLEPLLKQIKDKEQMKSEVTTTGLSQGQSGLGQQQLHLVETKLAQEAKLISEAKKKIERLDATLASSSI